MAKIDRPEAARWLARAIASDLSLYNEQKIIEGIQNDTLFELMREELQEGRELFETRVDESVRRGTNLYERAIVDILFKSKAHIDSAIW